MKLKKTFSVNLFVFLLITTSFIYAQGKDFINNESEFYCRNFIPGFSEFIDVAPGDIDCIEYYIDYYLYPSQHYFEEETEIIFESRINNLDTIYFYMYNDTLEIESVTSGQDTLDFVYIDSFTLYIQLNQILNIGEIDTIKIVYSGYVTPEFSALYNYSNRIDSILSYNSYSSYVFYPNQRLYDDLFLAKVKLTVPSGYYAVSGGELLDSTITDTTITYLWSTNHRVWSPAVSYAAAPYLKATRMYDSIEISYYDYDTTYADDVLTLVIDIVNFYSDIFCPFAFEKLALTEHLQGWGYSSYTLVIIKQPESSISHTAHEIAHQWWGNLFHIKTSYEAGFFEGVTEYSAFLYIEYSEGILIMLNYLSNHAIAYLSIPIVEDRPIIPTPHSSEYVYEIIYQKGSWILHMLRGVVGDSTFFEIIGTFAETYADSLFCVDDIVSISEQLYGEDLQWFFNQWLYHTGAPSYLCYWNSDSLGIDSVNITLIVKQLDSLFKMPIQTTIYISSGEYEEWIMVEDTVDTFSFLLSFEPDSIILDKDNWLLDRGITLLNSNSILIVYYDNNLSFIERYETVLNNLNISYITCNSESLDILPEWIYDNLGGVFWITGSITDPISLGDRDQISSLIDKDIPLILFSPKVAAQLQGSSFLSDTLGAVFTDSGINEESLIGISGDPIGQGMIWDVNSIYANVISPSSNGIGCAYWDGAGHAIVRNSGIKVALSTVDIRYIRTTSGYNRKEELIENILNYFGIEVGVEEIEELPVNIASIPLQISYLPEGNISFHVNSVKPTSLKIYDITGRIVMTWEVEGERIIVWAGQDSNNSILPMGRYFAVLENTLTTKQLILIK